MGDVIIELMLDRFGKRPELPVSPGQVLVTLFDGELYPQTVALASRLRRAGLRVEQVLEPMRLGKQIRFADRKGIPYVAILGPDELAAGKLVLKNLKTGEQQAYSEAEAVAHLQGWG
jgi:histidyl-tRNA synthetase